jgi:hypothetical protein
LRVNYCHCRFCQRITGSSHLVEPVFEKADFGRTSGSASVYKHRSAGSGKLIDIHFCATCGTKLFMTFERFPEVVGVFGGTFDDAAWAEGTQGVTRHLFLREAQPGTVIPAGVPCFEQHAITNDGEPLDPKVYSEPHVVGTGPPAP